MRILIVTQYFWPENFRINDLALRLKKRGHKVSVFTGLPNYPSGKIFPGWGPFKRLRESWEGIPIQRFPHFPRGNRQTVGMAANFISFALFGSILAPFIVKDDHDVIFVYEPSPVTVGFPAIVLKKFKKIPIVFWVQDLWPETFEIVSGIRNKRILAIVRWISSLIHKKTDRLLVSSMSFKPKLTKRGMNPEKVFYYPQSAEPFYKPLPPGGQMEPDDLPKGFRITYAGNIGVSQSVETIVEAAYLTREHPEIKWIIIGEGREFEKIKDMVSQMDLDKKVFLLGRKKGEEMPVYYGFSDVLLLTLKNEEIFSMTVPAKLQSYMACKKPILAAVNGETRDIITLANAGICVDSEDSKSLAEAAIHMFSSSKETIDKWARNSFHFFENNYSPEKTLDDLEKHFSEAIGSILKK